MTFKIYDKLCEDAKKLRTEVFVAEQGFETEFDDTDSKARHILGYDGEKPVALSAQLRASGFYEKQGYKKHGDEYYDEYCPHVLMTKAL